MPCPLRISPRPRDSDRHDDHTGLVECNENLASFSADDVCRILCRSCYHDHDSDKHDDNNGERHHEHANHEDTRDTVDNDSLQQSAGVQGVDDERSPRKLTVATFVSEYGGIGLRTDLVRRTCSVLSFAADDACRVLCVSRHFLTTAAATTITRVW